MAESKADLVLHPVRMRILHAFMGGIQGRQLTAQQLAEVLTDVPQATLYRHVNKLAKAGLLRVVEERQVRGATEKVYTLPLTAASIAPDELARLSHEDHMRLFATFVASLLGDFARYLERERVDYVADGVGYRQVGLYLSDEELQRFGIELSAVVLPALRNTPTPGRKRRMFTTILMPVDDPVEGPAQSDIGDVGANERE